MKVTYYYQLLECFRYFFTSIKYLSQPCHQEYCFNSVIDETEQVVEDEKPAPEVEMNIISNDVLADILKASGVIEEDIETQITQLTAIPQAVPENIMEEETRTEIIVQEDEEEMTEDSLTYTTGGCTTRL